MALFLYFFLFSEKNPGSGLKSLAYSFSHFPLLIRVIPVQVTRPDIIPLLPSHGRGGGGEGGEGVKSVERRKEKRGSVEDETENNRYTVGKKRRRKKEKN